MKAHIERIMLKSKIFSTLLLSVFAVGAVQAASSGKNIVFDAEFVQLRAQHGEE